MISLGNKILNDPESSSWRIDEIKNSRIKYFKLQGLDLGSDYETYVNYPGIKNYYPSKRLISTVNKVKNELKKKLAKKQFELTPVYKEYFSYLSDLNLKTIEEFSENLLFYTKEIDYKLFNTISIGTYVFPSITSDNRLHNMYEVTFCCSLICISLILVCTISTALHLRLAI